MTCAFFALINMIDNQEWHYIILPIGIFIWGIFKFFDENDREYLRRRGIDPDDYDMFFSDFYDDDTYGLNNHHNHNNHVRYQPSSYPRREGNTISWDGTRDYSTYQTQSIGGRWQNPAYNGMVKKCKRNFKITVNKKNENDKQERKSIFHSGSSFGW